MVYIILSACILSFLIGFFVLIGNPLKLKNISFAAFCFIASLWILFNFLIYYTYDLYYPRPAYAFGTLMTGAILSWTYVYYKKGDRIWKQILIIMTGALIAYAALFTDLIIESVSEITPTGIVMQEGSFMILFFGYILFTGIFAMIRMFRFYRKTEGVERHKNLVIFSGMGLFLGVALFVSGVLPIFGIYEFTNLDSVSSLFFVGFTSVAIYRHNFLGAKLVLAQLLILVMILINVFELLQAETQVGFILKSILLIFVFVLGSALILSIKKEVQRKEELEEVNNELRKLDQAKSEFISMASHQLRTPLTSMKGFIGLMKKGVYGEVSEEFQEPVEILDNSTNRLITLVADMLDISRLELGKMELIFEECNLSELLEELHRDFSVNAEERGISLNFQLDSKIRNIFCDRDRLREVISNIIDNAIKYTSEGSVDVSASLMGDSVRIVVKDSGIGLEKGEEEMLFQKFSRGRKAKTIKKEGMGLGLFIGRKIIEKHNGTICAHNNPNKQGMSFAIMLPIKQKNSA